MTRRLSRFFSAFMGCFCLLLADFRLLADPPFSGTIFIDPDILTAFDRTSFVGLTSAGKGERTMYDRRVGDWIRVNAFLFEATFDDGLSIEFQVNPEFGSVAAAQVQAERFAPAIGRLPTSLRRDVETVWIHRGDKPFGGGNNNLLIHTEQADRYLETGILEETLVHEASHTSLDGDHAGAAGWLAAQAADVNFISTYARDNASREDVAESFLPYLAVKYRRDRISEELAKTIQTTIPGRLRYFEELELDLYPVVTRQTLSIIAFKRDGRQWQLEWRSAKRGKFFVEISEDLDRWDVFSEGLVLQGNPTTVLLDAADPLFGTEKAFIRVVLRPE